MKLPSSNLLAVIAAALLAIYWILGSCERIAAMPRNVSLRLLTEPKSKSAPVIVIPDEAPKTPKL